jgi:hypothetical protein
MNTPARISSRQPVPELLALVRAIAEVDAEKDVAEWLAKQHPKDRKAAA